MGSVLLRFLVVSLALVGILWAMNMQHNGPTSATAKRAEAEATAAVSSMNFTAAATQLELYHAETEPVVEFYRAMGVLVPLHAERSIEEVSAEIEAALDLVREGRAA